jgi:NMD protein affecting ribosome stability and mRNA decay
MKCKRCGEEIEEPLNEWEKVFGMCEPCIKEALINVFDRNMVEESLLW